MISRTGAVSRLQRISTNRRSFSIASTCPQCKGHGQVRFQQGFFTVARTCPQCAGAGKIITKPCTQCRGAGRVSRDRKITAKIPAGVSDEQAAVLMLKGLTACYLLRHTYRVRRGDVIVVHAAAGGVGTLLAQWGRALGAVVIGVVGSEDKAKLAKIREILDRATADFVARHLVAAGDILDEDPEAALAHARAARSA